MNANINLEANKIISCNISNTKMKYCIYEELELNIKELIKEDIRAENIKAALNCLDTGLNSCLGKYKDKEFKIRSEFSVFKDEHNNWKIREIKLSIEALDDRSDLKEGLKQCLKFYRDYCTLKDVNIIVSIEIKGERL